MQRPKKTVSNQGPAKRYMDKRQQFLGKILKDFWGSSGWLDFNKKTKIVKYIQMKLKNTGQLLSNLINLIVEEQCLFFEQVMLYNLSKVKTIQYIDFIRGEDTKEDLNLVKNEVQTMADSFTHILRHFASFCSEELEPFQAENPTQDLLLILLDTVVALGNSKRRIRRAGLSILGQNIFPVKNYYKELPFAKNNQITKLCKQTDSLNFLFAARVLSNIEEAPEAYQLEKLKPLLHANFFSYCGAFLDSLFLGTCFGQHSLSSGMPRGNNSFYKNKNLDDNFLTDFFNQHERLLFTHEDKSILILVNFVSSILFCVNSLSVVGQTKQKVSKTLLMDAFPSVSETDKLIARETVLFNVLL